MIDFKLWCWIWFVPNAPCGVERILEENGDIKVRVFLMHRVELKVGM